MKVDDELFYPTLATRVPAVELTRMGMCPFQGESSSRVYTVINKLKPNRELNNNIEKLALANEGGLEKQATRELHLNYFGC